MIDKNRVTAKIIFIKEKLTDLEELAKLSEDEFKADRRNMASACYWLQTTIESMIDIAQHIAVREGLLKARDAISADFFRKLVDIDIISKDKFITYRQIIKFRNRIVHLYQEVDEDEVITILKENIGDLEMFIEEIVSYLKKL